MRTLYLYTYTRENPMKTGKKVEMDDGGIIRELNGEPVCIPVEDFGDYYLSVEPVDNAFEEWYAIQGKEEA